MTGNTTTSDTRRDDLDLGHPVRSFAAVLVLIGAVLLGLQWTGAVQPQLTTPETGAAEAAEVGGPESRTVTLENEGVVSIQIESIEWTAPGWTNVGVTLLPPDVAFPELDPSSTTADAGPIEPFTLHPGFDAAWSLVLTGTPTCSGQPSGTIEVHARTWLGIERTVTLPGSHGSNEPGPCP